MRFVTTRACQYRMRVLSRTRDPAKTHSPQGGTGAWRLICPGNAQAGLLHRRYARTAVSLNSEARSVDEKPSAMRLNEFHRTVYEADTLSTGKLLSNMQRSGPNFSMQNR